MFLTNFRPFISNLKTIMVKFLSLIYNRINLWLILKPYRYIIVNFSYFAIFSYFVNSYQICYTEDWYNKTIKEIHEHYNISPEGNTIFNKGNIAIPWLESPFTEDIKNLHFKNSYSRITHYNAIFPWSHFPKVYKFPNYKYYFNNHPEIVANAVNVNHVATFSENALNTNLYHKYLENGNTFQYLKEVLNTLPQNVTFPYEFDTKTCMITPDFILSDFKYHIAACNHNNMAHTAVNYIKEIIPNRVLAKTGSELKSYTSSFEHYMESFIEPRKLYSPEQISCWIHFRAGAIIHIMFVIL